MPIEVAEHNKAIEPVVHSRDGEATDQPERPVWSAMLAGARRRCPACETGPMFDGYLAVHDHCPNCNEALHHQQADDAPPYFTTFIVGHIVVGLVLWVEMTYAPATWVHAALWLPLTTVLALGILPVVKGILIAVQWSQRMHGFGDDDPTNAHEREMLALHSGSNTGQGR